jgi:hypothetical protein
LILYTISDILMRYIMGETEIIYHIDDIEMINLYLTI